ncbi:conserved hypothetical protein [Methanocella paludicola SANAE]|uniref:DUF2098 domain-containing protein n=1 Tax=Methanocella paludicola (strain DSM 17711 / JCM 13418 / NBRC 101707 / SANAE) TaxID=304371 RepID=D1YW03_METPS|nr:DUF2098 domain-containing protein [Methanocella paludicola]BAI60625.1 conserved hypothetical protein [Methanocella paludicola SANAE]
MEASESITANDLYGKPITVGATVKYVSTRTVGKVVEMKRENDKTWALLDKTRLYYDTRYLEVTAADATEEEDETAARVDMEEVEKKIRSMEDALKVKDINMDTSCEGGG